jgi:CHAT domain-containing protein
MNVKTRSAKSVSPRRRFSHFPSLAFLLLTFLWVIPLDSLHARGPTDLGDGFRLGIGVGIRLSPPQQVKVQVPKFHAQQSKHRISEKPFEKAKLVERPRRLEPASPRKLAKPRIPYLEELAMDIDKPLIEFAQTSPRMAANYYEEALSKAKGRHDKYCEASALVKLGHVYYLTGQLAMAAGSYEEAVDILGQLGGPSDQAVAMRNLSASFIAWAEYQKGRRAGRQALQIFLATGDTRGALMTLNNLGVLEKNRGRFQRAFEHYLEALKADETPSRFRLLAFRNRGNLRRTRGQYANALENFETSLRLARSLGNSKEEGEAFLDIGKVYAEWGKYDQALDNVREAADVFERTGAPTDLASKVMGDLYLDMGMVAEAEPYVEHADYDSSLGRLFLLKSLPEQAKKHYEQLLAAGKKAGHLDALFTAYTGLGKVFESMKKYEQAENYYSEAVAVTEEIRSNLLLSERKSFYAWRINGFCRAEPAKGLVRVTLKQQKSRASIYPSEVTRARDFADNLAQNAEGRYFGLPQGILDLEIRVNNKLASLMVARNVIPRELGESRFNELTHEIRRAKSEKRVFVTMLRTKFGEYASVKYPQPVKLAESALTSSDYVLFFDVLGEGVGVRLIKGKKVAHASFIQWREKELEDEVRIFRRSFEELKPRDFKPRLAASLYKRLLANALEKVPVGTRLIIVPDGILAVLPMEALVVSGNPNWERGPWGYFPKGLSYMGDRNPVIYSQSITALTLARKLRKKESIGDHILVMADPVYGLSDERARGVRTLIKFSARKDDEHVRMMRVLQEDSRGFFKLRRLEETGALARELRTLYGERCDVYTGFQCSKKVFLQSIDSRANGMNSIVLATHGFAANKIPGIMEPFLALTMVPPGRDGILTMSEVAGLNIKTDTAALTACRTGVGIKLAGEGVLSMGRAFQCAGARTVIMSLWPVVEDSSVMLMKEFFKHRKQGKTKLEAWALSRREVRNAGFEHPLFWAAFVLVGQAD